MLNIQSFWASDGDMRDAAALALLPIRSGFCAWSRGTFRCRALMLTPVRNPADGEREMGTERLGLSLQPETLPARLSLPCDSAIERALAPWSIQSFWASDGDMRDAAALALLPIRSGFCSWWRIFIALMTSDRKFEAPREGST